MILEAACSLLLADFFSGVFHWWEDRYGDPSWPVVGPLVVEPNITHHADQMAFVRKGYWERNWTTLIPATAGAAVAFLGGHAVLGGALLILGQANEIHSWAHQKCSRPIRGLQLLGILQSPEQHAQHHKRPFDRNYCTVTDFLNPVLQWAGFWPAVETSIFRATGIRPRPERETA